MSQEAYLELWQELESLHEENALLLEENQQLRECLQGIFLRKQAELEEMQKYLAKESDIVYDK